MTEQEKEPTPLRLEREMKHRTQLSDTAVEVLARLQHISGSLLPFPQRTHWQTSIQTWRC